jgi:hypothetical protein
MFTLKKLKKTTPIGDFYLHVPSSYVVFGVSPLSFLTELMQNIGIDHYHYKTLRHQILIVTIDEAIGVPTIIALAKEYIFLMSVLISQAYHNNMDLSCFGLATLTLALENEKILPLSPYFYKTLDIIKSVDVVDRIIEKRLVHEEDDD